MGATFSADDLPPPWLQSSRPLEVDLETLAQFAKALRDEVELNFGPHLTRILGELDDGQVPFQAKAGFLELAAAQLTYGDSRDRAVELLDAYAKGTRALADAADAVAAHYRGGDAFARATMDDVQRAFAQPTGPPRDPA
jgi:hypothetical protein